MSQKILISLKIQEEAPKKVDSEYCQPNLEKKIDEYIRRVEGSEIESKYEWNYLKRVYEYLSRKSKLDEQDKSILYKLEPVIMKYADSDSHNRVDLDSKYMHRGEEPNA